MQIVASSCSFDCIKILNECINLLKYQKNGKKYGQIYLNAKGIFVMSWHHHYAVQLKML